MSATVKYNGRTIATIANGTKTLKTSHKWLTGDLVITESGGSGGVSNLVTGTFKETTTGVKSIDLDYSGNGYPIAVLIYPTEGAYNSAAGTIYNLVQRYVVVEWAMTKSRMTTAPTYGSSGGAANYGVTAWIYKNSTSSATTYSRSSAMNTSTYSGNPSASGSSVCKFNSATVMRIFIADASYGFAPNVEYTYRVIYSD